MPDTSPLAIGAMLDDRYRVDELLSMGGMGAVYAGTHTLLQRRVAIKVLRSDLPAETSIVDRFRREAVAASAIGHENIVQVSDMGITADGIPYLVMELLEGRSLSDLLRAEGPLPVSRACALARDILRGVGAAHDAGIIHRDLKPDNVFVARQGRRQIVKLLDFGVSLLRRADVQEARLTSTGTVVGTPRYMAPEQVRGALDLTGAVDIYAAGVVLYEMLTCESPYQGQNYNEVVHEILAGAWNPIERRRGGIPPVVAAIVRQAMDPSPGERFASAHEMAAALDRFADRAAPGELLAPSPSSSGSATAARMAVALAKTEAVVPPSSRAGAGASGGAMPSPAGRVAAARPALADEPRFTLRELEARMETPLRGDRWPARRSDDFRPPRDRSAAVVVVSLAAIAAVVATAIYLTNRQDERVAASPAPAEAGAAASAPADLPAAAPPTDAPPAAPPAQPAPPPGPVTTPAPGSTPGSGQPSAPAAPASRQPSASGQAGASSARLPATAPPAPSQPPASAGPGSAAAPPAAEPAKAATEPAADAEEEVWIRLKVSPRSATVTVDDKPVRGKKVALTRGTRAVPVRVNAAGYVPRMVLVVPDHDQEVSIRLEKDEPDGEPAEPDAPKEPAPDPAPDDDED